MNYNKGDKVQIKDLGWYNDNKDEDGIVELSTHIFVPGMSEFCGKTLTIKDVFEDIDDSVVYYMEENDYDWTNEMIDSLIERNGKSYPYKIGDRVILKGNNRLATIVGLKYNSWGNLSYYIKIDNDKDISIDYPTELLLPYNDTMTEDRLTKEEPTKIVFKVGDRVLTDTSMKGQIIDIVEDGWYQVKFDPYNGIPQSTNIIPEDSLSLIEETKPIFKVGDKITNGKDKLLILNIVTDKYIVEDNLGECGTLYFNTQNYWKLMDAEVQSKYKVGDIVYSKTWQRDVVIQEVIPGGFYKVGDLQGIGWFTEHEDTISKDKDDCKKCGLVRNSARCLFMDLCPDNKQKNSIEIPENYVIKDENGNIINTSKLIVEKKLNAYPKTYEECCKTLDFCGEFFFTTYDSGDYILTYPENENVTKIQNVLKATSILTKLIICRNAYWKIAGDELDLGKPWEPDYTDLNDISYYGLYNKLKYSIISPSLFVFPTEEMRDAFYENFKDDIELCKTLV